MNDKKSLNFHYQMTKGRLAETIIEELFSEAGYDVHRFGMENIVPGILKKIRYNKSHTSSQIRKMPDFVMHKGDKVYFVEVKYKTDGSFNYDGLIKDNKTYPYEDCIVVVVSAGKIKALSVAELKGGVEITATCKNYLGRRKEFDIDTELIKNYLEIARIFFEHAPPMLGS